MQLCTLRLFPRSAKTEEQGAKSVKCTAESESYKYREALKSHRWDLIMCYSALPPMNYPLDASVHAESMSEQRTCLNTPAPCNRRTPTN